MIAPEYLIRSKYPKEDGTYFCIYENQEMGIDVFHHAIGWLKEIKDEKGKVVEVKYCYSPPNSSSTFSRLHLT